METFVPPWSDSSLDTDTSDSLAANHSGISTDVLLFSDIHLSLTHHYRVHKRGLPHIAFRKTYLTRLHTLVSKASGQSLGNTSSSPVRCRRIIVRDSTRRGRRRLRPVRILEEAVGELPTLTAHDPSNLQGAIVYDCRPPLLPESPYDSTILGCFLCVRQLLRPPGHASPGGLYGDRSCEPGAWCCHTEVS